MRAQQCVEGQHFQHAVAAHAFRRHEVVGAIGQVAQDGDVLGEDRAVVQLQRRDIALGIDLGIVASLALLVYDPWPSYALPAVPHLTSHRFDWQLTLGDEVCRSHLACMSVAEVV